MEEVSMTGPTAEAHMVHLVEYGWQLGISETLQIFWQLMQIHGSVTAFSQKANLTIIGVFLIVPILVALAEWYSLFAPASVRGTHASPNNHDKRR